MLMLLVVFSLYVFLVGIHLEYKPTLVIPSTPRLCAAVFHHSEGFLTKAQVYFDWLYRPCNSSRKREIVFLICVGLDCSCITLG